MAFEPKTFSQLLTIGLSAVPSDQDSREGSVSYEAAAIAATIGAQMYIDLEIAVAQQYVSTATGQGLENKGAERNVPRDAATPAIRQATFTGITPPTGSRYFTGETFWVQRTATTVECETAGSIGNQIAEGTRLIPVEDINGLTMATLGAVTVPGEEQQGIEPYRQEILDDIANPTHDSNLAQIIAWAEGIDGVHRVRAFSREDGANTVGVYIVGADGQPGTVQVRNAVETFIDPPRTSDNQKGLGNGAATIGLVANIKAPSAVTINVDFDATPSGNQTNEQIRTVATAAINAFLISQAFIDPVGNSAPTDNLGQISIAAINNVLFGLPEINDVQNLTLNSGTSNVPLLANQVAVIGAVNVT